MIAFIVHSCPVVYAVDYVDGKERARLQFLHNLNWIGSRIQNTISPVALAQLRIDVNAEFGANTDAAREYFAYNVLEHFREHDPFSYNTAMTWGGNWDQNMKRLIIERMY